MGRRHCPIGTAQVADHVAVELSERVSCVGEPCRQSGEVTPGEVAFPSFRTGGIAHEGGPQRVPVDRLPGRRADIAAVESASRSMMRITPAATCRGTSLRSGGATPARWNKWLVSGPE